jgi:hypothetical protein
MPQHSALLLCPLSNEAIGGVVAQLIESPGHAVLFPDLDEFVRGQRWILGAQAEMVQTGRVESEDLILDEPISRTQWCKPELFLHILGDFQPAQRLDLPLRRAVPH